MDHYIIEIDPNGDYNMIMSEKILKIKDIRALSGLSQAKFCQKYHIPLGTLKKWEADINSDSYRECPIYVKELLEQAVRNQFVSAAPEKIDS